MSFEALLGTVGRAHLALLHFPIALLVVAACLARFGPGRLEGRDALVRLLSRIGALGALLAVATGWLHAEHEPLGSTAADVLALHRWSGVACALFACTAAFAPRAGLRSATLVLAALASLAAGHLGGELVHGEGYLFELLRERAPLAPAPTGSALAAEGEPTFESHAFGVFQARCVECHGPLKQKGDLRLDQPSSAWFEPGEFGTVIVRGKPDESELVRRMLLPLDDEDHMPPSKKPQPAPEELELLRRWIAAGAR